MAGRALSFLAASLLLLGVLLPTNVVAAPADRDGHVVPPAVHDRGRAEGEVRVLVELLLPSGRVAEGAVPNQARALYRQEITDAASRLLSRLTQHPHRVLRRYVTAPLIALEAGPTALQALDASSSLVKRVTEDRIHTPRSEEHTSELQSQPHLVCRLLLEKKQTVHPPHGRMPHP